MNATEQLDFLARISDNPEIKHLVEKAKLVNVKVEQFCLRVWTTEDKTWEVRRSQKDGVVYCTCPSYRFSKKDPKTCKHELAISAIYTEDEIPVYVPIKERRRVFGTEI